MANQPSLIPSAWAANNSTTETIPATTTESGKASWDQGFPVETSLPLSEGGIPPKYGDFNGVLNVLSQFCLFAQSGGQYAWVNSLDYSVGSIVLGTDGSIYRAAQVSGPSTTAVNPVGDTSGKWERIVSKSDIDALEQDIQDAMDVASDAASNASAAQSAVTTLDANVVKLSGAQTISGAKTFSAGMIAATGDIITRDSDTAWTRINGGTNNTKGASILLYGKDATLHPGKFFLQANDGTYGNTLVGTPNGTLQWGGKDIITDGGSQTVGGNKTINAKWSTSYGDFMFSTVDNGYVGLQGGLSGNGALIRVFGKDNSSNPGCFFLRAANGTQYKDFIGKPDGTLTWDGKGFVYTTTNQQIEGEKTFGGTVTLTQSPKIQRANPYLDFVETDWGKGGDTSVTTYQGLRFHDKNENEGGAIYYNYYSNKNCEIAITVRDMHTSSATGNFSVNLRYAADGGMYFMPNNANVYLGYSGNNRWKQLYATTTTIATSDERQKTSISIVPDAVLNAWGEVQWQQFQMRDAVAEKGENARLHNGLIAQRIDAVFKAHGLDASRYGLFCHDTWEAEPEERDPEGKLVREARPAGDEYSLRYEEALCMEAAYQRRRADRAEARISALEQRLGELEAVLASLAAPVGDETYEQFTEQGQGASDEN
jgi:hypothetical protein